MSHGNHGNHRKRPLRSPRSTPFCSPRPSPRTSPLRSPLPCRGGVGGGVSNFFDDSMLHPSLYPAPDPAPQGVGSIKNHKSPTNQTQNKLLIVVFVLALQATRGRAVPVVFNTTIGLFYLIQLGPLGQRTLARQELKQHKFRLRQQPLSTESVSDSRRSKINF